MAIEAKGVMGMQTEIVEMVRARERGLQWVNPQQLTDRVWQAFRHDPVVRAALDSLAIYDAWAIRDDLHVLLDGLWRRP